MQKQAIQELALRLMEQHGLIQQGWKFSFDRAVKRAGCTHWGSKRITVSPLVTEHWTEAGVTDLILHEIAHAIAGHGAGHSFKWVRIAKSIGCNGERLYSGYDADTIVRIKPKWLGICDSCGRTQPSHKRFKGTCGTCDSNWNPAYPIRYIPND
jgi:SprT protein